MSFKNILIFVFGGIFAFLIINFFNKSNEKPTEVINKDYYILSNQINKMNKMIVLEQDFSSFQTHKSSAIEVVGVPLFQKEMVLYSTAKAQVTYDLKNLVMEVDSTNKKLIIKKIPPAEIKIYPDVKIHFMDDSALNRFSKSDLNGILESAKKNMVKGINQNQLKTKGKEQLINNLNDIFVLAKSLNYTIEDQTKELNEFL